MATMQAAMKDLRTLKQEESTMMNLASKISDQLNRLKVEELALQNLVRLQNEEFERKSRGSRRSLPVEELDDEDDNDIDEYLGKGDMSEKKVETESIVPLNLVVNKYHEHDAMEEEEEDDDDDDADKIPANTAAHEDIEQFVNSL
ncbi:snRNA-activating protein complex subunit 5-like [Mercenaria mercenaria]|uniref:snRNA-activating protein complex subunit 5-like n=1 Tax=Mercenaria mercenaria TaxID=6596 RepID=UPI001E1DF061|nr:snRNA-activating protein complex subunit 5-like [Mercenaria mercenaria]